MINEFFNNPYFQYLVSPAITASIIVFAVAKIINIGEFKERFKNLEKNLNNLDKDTNKIKSTIKNIEMDLTIMKAHLISETGMDTSLFSKNSPLTLTTKGENLLDQTEFRSVYKENKDWFLDEIKKHNVETESDIDEASYEVMEYCRDNEKFIDYKEIAYQNGLTTEVLLKVLAIYLREEAIKEILKKST
jgi:hypothetical protein